MIGCVRLQTELTEETFTVENGKKSIVFDWTPTDSGSTFRQFPWTYLRLATRRGSYPTTPAEKRHDRRGWGPNDRSTLERGRDVDPALREGRSECPRNQDTLLPFFPFGRDGLPRLRYGSTERQGPRGYVRRIKID